MNGLINRFIHVSNCIIGASPVDLLDTNFYICQLVIFPQVQYLRDGEQRKQQKLYKKK